ncbi:MAG TPA: aminoglycoside phosphotransferase family protein, partial [Gemmatimonadales bacterium]
MSADREAREALEAFAPPGSADLKRLAGGYINPTWRAGPLVLQRLNRAVFSDPEAVMRNVLAAAARIGAPRFVRTLDGAAWHTAADASVWRAYAFVEGRTVRRATAPDRAEVAAHAFGSFLRQLSKPAVPLEETLPGFHDTMARLGQLEAAAARDPFGRVCGVRAELDRILGEEELAGLLGARLRTGTIPRRIAHNDARIANVVFDPVAHTARCVIDLDTVMPGTPLHDFGDLVRSMVTGFPDEAPDPSLVQVREEYFAAVVRGFLGGMAGLLTPGETALLV